VIRVRLLITGLVVLTVAVLGPAAVAGAESSFHHGPSQLQTVKGLVTSITSTSIHVQTQGGSVPVGLSSSATIVARIVVGSAADLARGQQIDAQLTSPGSGVIKSIHIELSSRRPNAQKGDTRRTSQSRSRSFHDGGDQGSPRLASLPTSVSGQIVSVGSNSVTVRLLHGNTATYTFAGNLSVTKTMPGRMGDLAVGETVMAWVVRASGVASQVTILSY
jgi:hypothetical protein